MADRGEREGAMLTVNGRSRPLRASRVDGLLDEMGLDRETRGIAVAVNGEVVPRGEWSSRELADGDVVDIVGAVQGG